MSKHKTKIKKLNDEQYAKYISSLKCGDIECADKDCQKPNDLNLNKESADKT